jgi:hypothetical protein
MAFEIPGTCITLEAAADLSAKQYYFVYVDSNGQAAVCSAATDQPIGILQDKPAAAGRACTVMVNGISKVSSDAALSLGNKVGTSADGQAAAYAFGTDKTAFIVGTVIGASGGAAGLATIIFDCMSPARGA